MYICIYVYIYIVKRKWVIGEEYHILGTFRLEAAGSANSSILAS